jgi:hypothetical protein
MVILERTPLTAFAVLSLAASVLLVAVPFVSPHTPIAPFIVANWLPFIVVGFMARRRWTMFYVVLVAFALAGVVAALNAEAIF